MKSDALKDLLCRTFCSELSVREVPAGLAFSGVFKDALGDRIAGYLVQDQGAQYLSDDGAFLADLDAANVAVFDGARAAFLERVLTPANAFADPETFEIRTHAFEGEPPGSAVVEFLAALVRAHDVGFWSQERVRSSFVADVIAAMAHRFAGIATIDVNTFVDSRFADFPADAVIRPLHHGAVTAVFVAQTIDKLTEAMLLAQELRIRRESGTRVVAVIEDIKGFPLQGRKAQRAMNRIQGTVFYRGDEDGALDRLAEVAGLQAA